MSETVERPSIQTVNLWPICWYSKLQWLSLTRIIFTDIQYNDVLLTKSDQINLYIKWCKSLHCHLWSCGALSLVTNLTYLLTFLCMSSISMIPQCIWVFEHLTANFTLNRQVYVNQIPVQVQLLGRWINFGAFFARRDFCLFSRVVCFDMPF